MIDSRKEKAEWAGTLVPAVELDRFRAHMTLVVVRLIDERQAWPHRDGSHMI